MGFFVRLIRVCLMFFLTVLVLSGRVVGAQPYSVNQQGVVGLNTVPSARFDLDGTLRLGASLSDIHLNSFMGLQVTPGFYLSVRQTAEISNPLESPDRFYPGVDAKIRIASETPYRPQVALGVQSGIGHARMGGEYLALSKRYKDFDFTAGLGWGRYGSAYQLANPLKSVSSHFSKARNLDGEMPVDPSDWFAGESVGFFGGIEYFTSFRGLSVKMDLGADRYEAEKAAFGYDTPAPWSVGLNYHYDQLSFADVDASLAVMGGERVMGRVSLSQVISRWKKASPQLPVKPLPERRTQGGVNHIALSAEQDGVVLQSRESDSMSVAADLLVRPGYNLPQQLNRAAIHMASHALPEVERLSITPVFLGLRGAKIDFMRADFEKAEAHQRGSAEEIWRNISVDDRATGSLRKRHRKHEIDVGFMPFDLSLKHQTSLADEDHGALHRTSLLAKLFLPRKTGYLDYGGALRLNLNDNLRHVEDLRPKSVLPVRSDVADFANSFVSLDQAFVAFTHSFSPNLHVSAMNGLLEEMYAGTGGEILYRPFKKRFALGAEGFAALKRDPDTALDIGLTGDAVFSGFINGWYDIGHADTVLTAKLGRFLNEDFGARVGVLKHFKNGAKFEGYVSLSDQADYDLFGGTAHADHGFRLSLPLGGFKPLPDHSHLDLVAAPFGRDSAQVLEKPIDLYQLTEPMSYSHIIRHWDDITAD